MVKKMFLICTISISVLILWIYWSSVQQFQSTITILRKKHHLNQNFLVKPNGICRSDNFLVILVTSYVGHTALRHAHRKAMTFELLNFMNASRIFLLAKLPLHEKNINQDAVLDESNLYGDILQGSFIEDYKNLTYKHLMGLQWASRECANAKYILKVDDDTVFSLERTYDLILKLKNMSIERDQFLVGYMLNKTKPNRFKENKWYVTQEEYSRTVYPTYLSGWYYITTPTTAARLCEEAIYHTYFWIDDIFVTGILTEALSITLKHVPNYYWLEYYELLECCLKDMLTKKINCEYSVGPNGGRNDLIFEFNAALQLCNLRNNCLSRPRYEPLNRTCVMFRERSIFSIGKAEVKMLR